MSKKSSTDLWFGGLPEDMKLRDFLNMALRRKLWIILSTIGIFLATAVYAYRLPNTYRAETVILVDPQQVPDRYVSSTVSSTISDRLSTLQQQVLSPTRLGRLIQTLGLFPNLSTRRSSQDLIAMMQHSIVIELVNPGGGRLSAFRIAYHSSDPAEAALVANQLAEMFIAENLKAREQQYEGTSEFLESELRESKRQLDQKDAELRVSKSENLLDLPESKAFHLEALASLRSQMQASQDRMYRAQEDKALLLSMAASNDAAPTIDQDSGAGSGAAAPYQAQIQKLEARLSDLQARYGPRHPDVVKLQRELDRLKAKARAAEEQPGAQGAVTPALPPASQRAHRNPVIEAQVQKLEQEIEEQTKLQARMQVQVNMHVARLQQVPIFEQKIAGLLRDYDILRTHYTSLLDKKLSAQTATAMESHQKAERFVVLDSATPPLKPFAPNRMFMDLAGLLGGFLGGLVLAFLAEMNDESVRTDSEAARIVGKPILGGIPCMLTQQERRLRSLRTAGALAGTIVCSVAVGFLASFATGLF